MFSFTAMVMNYTGRIGTIVLIIAMLFAAILLFELIGLINEKHQFILKQKYLKKWNRHIDE